MKRFLMESGTEQTRLVMAETRCGMCVRQEEQTDSGRGPGMPAFQWKEKILIVEVEV